MYTHKKDAWQILIIKPNKESLKWSSINGEWLNHNKKIVLL